MSYLVFFALMLSLSSGSALSGQSSLVGRVSNHMDGSAVAGAFVIARWTHYGSNFFGSRASCSHIEITRSDAQGRFVIPLAESEEPQVTAYMPGFDAYRTESSTDEVLELVPFTGAKESRDKALWWIGSLSGCKDNDIFATLRPLYQAVDEERRSLGLPAHAVDSLDYGVRLRREEQERARTTK